MDEALRLHLALCTVAERLAGVMEGARFERRNGYVLVTFRRSKRAPSITPAKRSATVQSARCSRRASSMQRL